MLRLLHPRVAPQAAQAALRVLRARFSEEVAAVRRRHSVVVVRSVGRGRGLMMLCMGVAVVIVSGRQGMVCPGVRTRMVMSTHMVMGTGVVGLRDLQPSHTQEKEAHTQMTNAHHDSGSWNG